MEIPQPKCSPQTSLTVLILVGFYAVFGWILTHPIPAENHDAVVFVLGLLGTVVGGATGYFFGSSAERKNSLQLPTASSDAGGFSATITATTQNKPATAEAPPAPVPPTPASGA
jgi:hypothetical protein